MKNSQGNVFKVCQKTSNTQRPDINFHLAASNKRKEEYASLAAAAPAPSQFFSWLPF